MQKISIIFVFLFTFNLSFAQAFRYLEFGRSAISIGTGEQNLTLLDPVNAMAGNPANLVSETGVQLSLFKNPFYFFFPGLAFPLTNFVASLNYQDNHFIGLEFSNFTLHQYANFDYSLKESYERSISIGYARKINNKFSLGTKLTFGMMNSLIKTNHFMLSMGLSYSDKFLGKDFNVGLSFMNFGLNKKTKINGNDYYLENPSLFLLGMNYNFLSSELLKTNLLLEFRKEILTFTDGKADNSFKAFTKSWEKIDDKLKVKLGLILNSKKVHLGGKFNLANDYFIGYSTERFGGEYYNFGLQFSLSYNDYTFSTGFGGRWFSARNYLSPQIYGYETFDFTIKKNLHHDNKSTEEENVTSSTTTWIFGLARSNPLGLFRKDFNYSHSMTTDNFLTFSLDFEFRIYNEFSIINSISYWKSVTKLHSSFLQVPIIINKEAYSLYIGFVYYPLADLIGDFFLSSKLGVLRLNPVESFVYPKYSNIPIISLSTGYKWSVLSTKIKIIPFIEFVAFLREALEKDEVYGYKKLDYGLKLGYQL